MLLKNESQKRILFAEDGIERWHSASVARAIVRRIRRTDTIVIDESDVTVIHRMAEVLFLSQSDSDPGFKIGWRIAQLEVPTVDILRIFE